MANYRVSMWIPVSTSIDVEADTVEDAIAVALENAPAATNASNDGIDEAGEWTANAVYDESNAQVWDDTDDSADR